MRTFPRVPLIAVGVAVGALGLALSVWAFWPDPSGEQTDDDGSGTTALADPDGDTATTTRPTSPTTADPLDDAEQVRSTLAEGFHDDFAPYVDLSEADCLAEAVVAVLGPDRLRELGEVMASAGPAPGRTGELGPTTPEERRDLDQRMRPCVADDTASRLGL